MSDDILKEIRGFAPTMGPHPDATTRRGFRNERRVMLSAALKRRNRDVRKFLVIARARSGSTLLTDLLNSHPDVTCDREVLAKKVRAPATFLDRLAGKSRTRAYGAKLLSYQMVQVQEFDDPVGFLRDLQGRGFRFIHLKRDTFAQTVSLTRAQASQLYHSKSAGGAGAAAVDPDEFVRRLLWNAKLAEYEDRCLRDFDPLTLRYETDLMEEDAQQASASRVFARLGLPAADVRSGLKKLLPGDPRRALENYDAVAAAVAAAGLGDLLPGA